ncbi:MAG TPA: hypothetical protein DEB74_00795 [Lachnospiraceae bacterium]|nr:hypothetical protein [Lachnospiraceae bacterium]
MDTAKMKEILKAEYEIYDEAKFNAAVSKSVGINLGIFTIPLTKRSVKGEQTCKKLIELEQIRKSVAST